MYAQDDGGEFPARLEDLVLSEHLAADVFICPSSEHELARGDSTEELAAALSKPEHLSYLYVGGGLDLNADGGCVLAYERCDNHSTDGMNVLFVDGHAEFFTRPEAERMIAEVDAGHNPPRPRQSD